MKIIKLVSENVKRLKAVEIEPKDPVVIIGGKNGAGKSSVLDSIVWAFFGKRLIQEKPIRDGEDEAFVEVDLGDIIVERRWTHAASRLKVRSKDGAEYRSPQKWLEDRAGNISFDAMAFAKMTARERVKMLLNVFVKGFDMDAHRLTRQSVYDERTQTGRDIKTMEGALEALDPLPEDLPDKPTDINDLLAEKNRISNLEQDRREMERDIEAMRLVSADSNNAMVEEEKKAAMYRQKADELDAKVADRVKAIEAREKQISKNTERMESLVIPDASEIDREITEATLVNALISERNKAVIRREGLTKNLNDLRSKSAKQTKRLEEIDEEKDTAIQAADFPIEGLSVDESDVLYNGIPFEQTSSAEQLKVSLSIAMAANPEIRVIRIMDGSLLDEDNMQVIEDMAIAEDYQVWIERVGEGDESAVIIEEGELK